MGKSDLIELTSGADAFVHFSAAHLLAILCIVLAAMLAVLLGRKLPVGARPALAVFLAVVYGGIELYWMVSSFDTCARARDCLPLHLCDFSVILAVLALATRWRFPFEFIYFFGLGGTFQAIVTPDLPFTFPDEYYFRFFVGHGGIIIAVAFLIAAFGLRPTGRSVVKMVVVMYGYVIAISIFNWVAKTNYGYTCSKPSQGSLLDVLGPWPWYVLFASFIAVVNIVLLYLPYFLLDRVRGRGSGKVAKD